MTTMQFKNQTVSFDGTTLTVSRRGFGAAMSGGFGLAAGRGDHSVPLKSVTSVEVRDGITEFYVRFRVKGHNDIPSTYNRIAFGSPVTPIQTSGMQRAKDPFYVRLPKGPGKPKEAIQDLKTIADEVRAALAETN